MTRRSYIPSRAEARHDPAHAAWWPLVEAVEACRREPSVARRRAVLTAQADLLVAMDREARR